MNISQRIHARKIVLSYFYQCCFFHKLQKNEPTLVDTLALDHIFTDQEDFPQEKEKFIEMIKSYQTLAPEEELLYDVSNFFDKLDEKDIDMDYLFQVGSTFVVYCPIVEKQVDTYTTSFSFNQMDIIDQSLFVLGYAEYKVLHTPKEILLNELVELAKRYADAGSAKLVNGIMHKIIVNQKEN